MSGSNGKRARADSIGDNNNNNSSNDVRLGQAEKRYDDLVEFYAAKKREWAEQLEAARKELASARGEIAQLKIQRDGAVESAKGSIAEARARADELTERLAVAKSDNRASKETLALHRWRMNRYVEDGPAQGRAEYFVATLTGKKIPVVLSPSGYVFDVMVYLQAKENIPIEQQRLVFTGRQLEPENPLSQIPASSVIHLILRLGGD